MTTWGVLMEAGKTGQFDQSKKQITPSEPVAALMFEALIRYNEGAPLLLTALQHHPSLFGFDISLSSRQIRTSASIDISMQGVDSEIIALRTSSKMTS